MPMISVSGIQFGAIKRDLVWVFNKFPSIHLRQFFALNKSKLRDSDKFLILLTYLAGENNIYIKKSIQNCEEKTAHLQCCESKYTGRAC